MDESKIEMGPVTARIPEEVVQDFVKDMEEEVRSAPDLLTAIVVKYYRQRQKARLARRASQSIQTLAIPTYGEEPPPPSGEPVEAHPDAK